MPPSASSNHKNNITVIPPQFNNKKKSKKVMTKYRGDAIFMGASNVRDNYSSNGFRSAVSCQGFQPVQNRLDAKKVGEAL